MKLLLTLALLFSFLYAGQWAALELVVRFQSLDWLYIVGIWVGILGPDLSRWVIDKITFFTRSRTND